MVGNPQETCQPFTQNIVRNQMGEQSESYRASAIWSCSCKTDSAWVEKPGKRPSHQGRSPISGTRSLIIPLFSVHSRLVWHIESNSAAKQSPAVSKNAGGCSSKSTEKDRTSSRVLQRHRLCGCTDMCEDMNVDAVLVQKRQRSTNGSSLMSPLMSQLAMPWKTWR